MHIKIWCLTFLMRPLWADDTYTTYIIQRINGAWFFFFFFFSLFLSFLLVLEICRDCCLHWAILFSILISLMLLRLRFKLIGLMIVSGTRPTSKRSKSSVIGRFGGQGCTIWGTSFQSFPPSSKIHNVGHELAFVVGLFDFMYLKFCGNCDLFLWELWSV